MKKVCNRCGYECQDTSFECWKCGNIFDHEEVLRKKEQYEGKLLHSLMKIIEHASTDDLEIQIANINHFAITYQKLAINELDKRKNQGESQNGNSQLNVALYVCSACKSKMNKESIFCPECGTRKQSGSNGIDIILKNEKLVKDAKEIRRIYGIPCYKSWIDEEAGKLGIELSEDDYEQILI